MLILSQANCEGITFCLGRNDKDPLEHTTLIAFGAKIRMGKDGHPATNDQGKIIIEPIKKEDPNDPPRPLYEVVPPTTLAQVLVQEKKDNFHEGSSPSYTTFL